MVGLGRALEFAYTGELSAERAYECVMLNHLVPSKAGANHAGTV